MGLYEDILRKPLPQDTLILPLQYWVLGNRYDCAIFVQVEENIGKGASKSVFRAKVEELIGSVPLPEVTSLKGKHIVVYRPRGDFNSFLNDIIAIVKLGQMKLSNYKAKSNLVKIKGHSLYVSSEYEGTEIDYSNLLYSGYLKLTTNIDEMVEMLDHAVASVANPEIVAEISKEILEYNDIIDSPFMICDVLPKSLDELIYPGVSDEVIFQSLYQIIYTIASYAQDGIFFRDLQIDNFRANEHNQVKLIDPSYIDSTVLPKNRYFLFIKQTTPEYLPNYYAQLSLKGKQEESIQYFGEYTEGVCFGMLERVLKRLFLPQYMGEKYDNLFTLGSPEERITTATNLKFREDLDFFKDLVEGIPSECHFAQYKETTCELLKREGFSDSCIPKIAKVITSLRKFSYPVFTDTGCHGLLKNETGEFVTLNNLIIYIQKIFGVSSTTSKQMPYQKPQGGRIPRQSTRDTERLNPIRPDINTRKRFAPLGSTKRLVKVETGVIRDTTRKLPHKELEPITPQQANPRIMTKRLRKTTFPIEMPEENTQNKTPSIPKLQAPEKSVLEAFQQGGSATPEINNEEKKNKTPIPGFQAGGSMIPGFQRGGAIPSQAREGSKNSTPSIPGFQRGGAITSQRNKDESKSNTPSGFQAGGSMIPGFQRGGAITSQRNKDESKSNTPSGFQAGGSMIPGFQRGGSMISNTEGGSETKTPTIPGFKGGGSTIPGFQRGGSIPGIKKETEKRGPAIPGFRRSGIVQNDQDDLQSLRKGPMLPKIETSKSEASNLVRQESEQEFSSEKFEKILFSVIKELKSQNLITANTKIPEAYVDILKNKATTDYKIEEIQTFYSQVRKEWQQSDFDFNLFRHAQLNIPENIDKILERYASSENKNHFKHPSAFQKCKKNMANILIKIVKIRFLIQLDEKIDIANFFPGNDENILDFIINYDFSISSLKELANHIATEIK